MSIKSILFFVLLFGIVIFGYFYYDIFLKYFPINIVINLFVVIIGIFGIFFPQIIKKMNNGDDYDEIKEFIIDKYSKK
jgi:hypothetical protein